MKRVAQTVITTGKYYVVANACGKVMEGEAGNKNGGAVVLGSYTHKPCQEWAFLRVGEGVYRIQNRGTGKMLDLMMSGTADGTWLHQWEDANCSSQMWIVETSNNGSVKIKAQTAPAKCMDVAGISGCNGAHLQIWQDVNGENQHWTIREAAEKKTRAAKPAEAKEKTEAEKTVVSAATAVKPVAQKAAAAPKKPAAKPAVKKPAKKAVGKKRGR